MIIWYQGMMKTALSASGKTEKEQGKWGRKHKWGSFQDLGWKINRSAEDYKLGEVIDSSLFTHGKDELLEGEIT